MARKVGGEKSRTECLRIENGAETSEWKGQISCECEVMKGWRKTSKSKPTITFPTSLDFFPLLHHLHRNPVSLRVTFPPSAFHCRPPSVCLHPSPVFSPSILPTQHFPSPFAMPMRSRYHTLITERRKEREDLPHRCCFVFAGVFDAGVLSPSCRKNDFFF